MIKKIKCWIWGHDWVFMKSMIHQGDTHNLFRCLKCQAFKVEIFKGRYF